MSKSKKCCFTSANHAYFGRARLLAETFKAHNPDVDFILVLNDKSQRGALNTTAQEPFDRIIEIEDLGIDDFDSWSFGHNVVELCTAVKPSAARVLLDQYDYVMYLDPDIAVFDSLAGIYAALDDSPIQLTPHQLQPCAAAPRLITDIELCSLKHGVFNLGFFAVRACEIGRSFISWWESRVLQYCYEDIASGVFTDQKWCDIAPCYFPRLGIVRDFGCNVASWNLNERFIEYCGDRLLVNGRDSLKFYHFTKYGGVGDAMTQRYARSPVVHEIWYWYGRMLRQRSLNIPAGGAYWYGTFSNGQSILDAHRISYRKLALRGLNPYNYDVFVNACRVDS